MSKTLFFGIIYGFNTKFMPVPQDDSSAVPNIPSLPANGKEFFDTLMGRIEKDLTSENVAALKERYAHETPEEHLARMERYKMAMTEYRKRSAEYFTVFREQIRKFGKQLDRSLEGRVKDFEQKKLEHIESIFNT